MNEKERQEKLKQDPNYTEYVLIADNIRYLCKQKNITINKLNEKANIGKMTVHNLLHLVSAPRKSTLDQIAEALNVELSLFYETDIENVYSNIQKQIDTAFKKGLERSQQYTNKPVNSITIIESILTNYAHNQYSNVCKLLRQLNYEITYLYTKPLTARQKKQIQLHKVSWENKFNVPRSIRGNYYNYNQVDSETVKRARRKAKAKKFDINSLSEEERQIVEHDMAVKQLIALGERNATHIVHTEIIADYLEEHKKGGSYNFQGIFEGEPFTSTEIKALPFKIVVSKNEQTKEHTVLDFLIFIDNLTDNIFDMLL